MIAGDDDSIELPDAVVDNAADAQQIAAKHRKVKFDEKREAEFWQRSLSDPVGRQAIWNLLQSAKTFGPQPFGVGPNGFPQAEASFYAAGQRDFGLRLYHMLAKFDRLSVFKMHDENDSYFAQKTAATRSRTGD